MKKIDPNKMSPQELEEYVNSLPDKVPPKWSSVAWMVIVGIVAIIFGALQMGFATGKAWAMIIGGIIALGIAGYLIYKILNFNKSGG